MRKRKTQHVSSPYCLSFLLQLQQFNPPSTAATHFCATIFPPLASVVSMWLHPEKINLEKEEEKKIMIKIIKKKWAYMENEEKIIIWWQSYCSVTVYIEKITFCFIYHKFIIILYNLLPYPFQFFPSYILNPNINCSSILFRCVP